MTAKKAAAEPADEAPEMVTVYHPDARLNQTRQVPADKLERWKAQGWLDENPRSN